MSAAAPTKIFGLKIAIDPKILAGLLVAIVGFVFWYNMRSDDEAPAAASSARTDTAAGATQSLSHRKARPDRRNAQSSERNTLRIKSVDATDGSIDPTLRIDLIARLQSLAPPSSGRSLFEVEQAPTPPPAPIAKVVVPVNAPPAESVPVSVAPPHPVVNIPLKYYGFVHPASKSDYNRGLFLDGDNILVAKEGDQLDGKYLVVELNANSAKMEDTQLRQGQTLPVSPEATAQ